jgi:flavin-dependent dehydrogenase
MKDCTDLLTVIYNTSLPPPLTDRLVSLIPFKIERQLMKANMDPLIKAESARFDALEASGFRVDREAVLTDWLLIRGGGYYIDVGTSKRIADGDIKIKSGPKIVRFNESGLVLGDGDELEADVVVLATGYQKDPRRQVAGIVGEEIAGALPWGIGMKADGERRGDLTPSGKLS